MFSLGDLSGYEAVVLQCHDNPDADTIAGAWALYVFFKGKGIPARLVYGGFNRISKPNLTGMVEALHIPIEYVGKDIRHIRELLPDANEPLLITVDCQYGAGNVSLIECGAVCVIDHHLKEKDLAQYERIEPWLGSCSTVVWRMLAAEGFDFAHNRDVSTALYYGLYTDTNSFSELHHPADRDMLEGLWFDQSLIKRLKGSNLTKTELLVAGRALGGTRCDETHGAALFRAEPCDPNILGFISDLTLQVDGMDVCVGFCEINGGVKLSLRSGTGEVMASELAAWLTRGVGSGGGNREKAGGFLRLPADCDGAEQFLAGRLEEYFSSYDKIVAGQYRPDLSTMKQYRKKKRPMGFVKLSGLFPAGAEATVRTLEGDAVFTVSEDVYLMIGVKGEAYPIDREKFEKSYRALDGAFAFDPSIAAVDGFYHPTVREKLYGRTEELIPHARPCLPLGETCIWARPMERAAKVFSKWYADSYMAGEAGDYLAIRGDDPDDVYIIAAGIFPLTYEEA